MALGSWICVFKSNGRYFVSTVLSGVQEQPTVLLSSDWIYSNCMAKSHWFHLRRDPHTPTEQTGSFTAAHWWSGRALQVVSYKNVSPWEFFFLILTSHSSVGLKSVENPWHIAQRQRKHTHTHTRFSFNMTTL